MSGPGQAMPRASMDRSTWIVLIRDSLLHSDEDDGPRRGREERGDPLHAVHERVELLLVDAEYLHGMCAGIDRDFADALRLREEVGPMRARSFLLPDGARRLTRFRRDTVIGVEIAGTECTQRPVLQQDVDTAAHRGGADGKDSP